MAPPKHSAGKFKGKKPSLPPKPTVADPPDDESSVSDASDMVDDDYGSRTFLLNSSISKEGEGKKNQRKRRRTKDEDAEDSEEEKPRVMPGGKKQQLDDPSQKLHFLLPVKSGDGGVQMRYRQVEDVREVAKVAEAKKIAEEKAKAVAPKNTEYKKFGNDPKWKQRVASLAFDVLEDPEKNLRCVRELLSGLAEVEAEIDAQITTAIMASLTEIFKDILPGYRIHVASEVEQDQLMKKETLQLRHHEEALLGVYQKFLQQLEKAITIIYKRKDLAPDELARAGCAVKCISELLVTRIDFNFRKNLIDSMVHISTCPFPALVEISVSTIQRIFKQDRQGDATVDTMASVSKVAKTKGHKISPLLLEAFMDVKVSKDLLKSLADEKEKAAKLDRKLLSYKERKHKKEVAKVEKELQNNQLEENKKLKGRLHSQIIQSVFAIYFRILRREDDKVRMRLLPSVLKGVARFVHFIGVEYMDDLVKTLNGIVENEDCKPLEKLLCVRTVFAILSGDGSSLNIDPFKFYEHLFKVLHSLDGTENRALYIELFHCVQKGFIERRKLISADRAARCAKGLANLALRSATKEGVAVSLLLKAVFIAHPSLDRYLDAEFVSSTVAPGGDMGSASGPLWELHQLRKHHHPANRAIIDALLGNPKSLTNNFSKLLHCDPVEYLADASTDIFDA